MELQGRADPIKRSGLGLVGISYDPVTTPADFSKRRGITFRLLSDSGSETIRRYGIFNTTVVDTSKITYGIPFPGTFFVDANGVVTSRLKPAIRNATRSRVSWSASGRPHRRASHEGRSLAPRADHVRDRSGRRTRDTLLAGG